MLLAETLCSLKGCVSTDQNLHPRDTSQYTIFKENRGIHQLGTCLIRGPTILKNAFHLAGVMQVRHQVLEPIVVASRIDVKVDILELSVLLFE